LIWVALTAVAVKPVTSLGGVVSDEACVVALAIVG
jgi:hypothetical protein